MSASPVIFNNTVIRDGHQSLAATRITTEQMLPALEMLDSLGFGCIETWGGATIDAGLRFLNEFPFDRLDAIRKRTKPVASKDDNGNIRQYGITVGGNTHHVTGEELS